VKYRVPNIVDAMRSAKLFGPFFLGQSWNNWQTVLKGAHALPMTETETAFFRSVTLRDPPTRPVRELWINAGRRAGKDSFASFDVAYSAATFSNAGRLRKGERCLCLGLACSRDQAKIVLNYTRAYFTEIPALKAMVQRETADGFELSNGVDVVIGTNNFRSVRGRPVLRAVLDECAYYRDENSANPDEELYRALTPGMATLAGDAMLIGISTPYRKAGLLYRKFKDHFGKDGDVLVVKAPSKVLNPTLDRAIIDDALAADPQAASAEWLAEFRSDIDTFVSRDAVEACVAPNVYERAPLSSIYYSAFCDPAGGGGTDAMTLAIAHRENDIVVLDCIREHRPRFSPEDVVKDFSDTLKSYGISTVCGDRYAGEWPRERFNVHGIKYEPAAKPKSDLYRDLLPAINSRKVDLLDHPKLVAQLCSLERRTARGGRDSIDHPPGPSSHDDVANCCAGVITKLMSGVNSYDSSLDWVGGPELPINGQQGQSLWNHPLFRYW
jgi:hypothetical protein